MEAELRIIDQSDWVTIVIFLSILLMVIAKQLFQSRFFNFIILPFNNKYIALYSKKDKMLHGFHIMFTGFQLLNTALYIYIVYDVLLGHQSTSGLLEYGLILGILILFILCKVFLQLANGFVFNNVKTIADFIYKKHTYLNYSGMVMLVSNISLTYIFKGSEPIVFLSLFLILLINIIGFITILKYHQKLISAYFFYFILYLCALEIAPLIFIANYLKF
ncbi:MAG: DUF4271 domain-containing protein [Flavobacteriaceae bacterium]